MIIFLILLFVGGSKSDYDCLCNYNVEISVYPTASIQGQPIGYLYEFDCKPLITNNHWATIAFEHQIGYIETDGQTSVQICTGDIPETDKLSTTTIITTTPLPTTTTAQPTTTTPQPTTTTTQPTTTTPQPTTPTPVPTTTTPVPTTTTPQPTTTQPTTTTTQPTTTTQQQTTTTTQPTPTTPQPTTNTAQPTTTQPRTTTPQPTTTTPQPTTTTPQQTTTTPHPTTTTPQPTTTMQQTTTTTPQSTTATPQPTTTTPQPTTQKTTTTTQQTTTPPPTTTKPQPTVVIVNSSSIYGTLTCPQNVVNANSNHDLYVSNTQQKCYEFNRLPKHSWSYADNDCKSKGGHLVSVRNIEEESIVHKMIESYGQSVWIGLHDNRNDGTFNWISGQPLAYLNWSPNDHKDNGCVVMDHVTGTWNSVTCSTFFSYICEYDGVISGQSLPPTTPATTTTTTPLPTTTTTTQATTTTTTPLPTTTTTTQATTSITQGQLTCPPNVLAASSTEHYLIVSTYHRKCYQFVKSPALSWNSAEQDCVNKGGYLATVQDDYEERILYSYIQQYGYPAWIGLNDRAYEGNYNWVSGKHLTYQNWHSASRNPMYQSGQDCVVIDSRTTHWFDQDCTARYPYFCEFDAVYGQTSMSTSPRVTQPPRTTAPPSIYNTQGNIRLCPSHIYSESLNYNGVYLGQSGSWCYELFVGQHTPWNTAESMCRSRGGYLVHIQSTQEQNFVEAFTSKYSPQAAVWIGLHDINYEGYYQWSSGVQVTFTNFVPGHIGNQNGNRYAENCGVILPYQNGKWDDVPCGSTSIFGGYTGYIHSPFCQYQISTYNPQLIGK